MKTYFLILKKLHANFLIYYFEQIQVSIPGSVPHRSIQIFQASKYRQFLHIAFVHDGDKDRGRWLKVNIEHYDYKLGIVLTLVKVTNTTRL